MLQVTSAGSAQFDPSSYGSLRAQRELWLGSLGTGVML
jgi:hypothetical protein